MSDPTIPPPPPVIAQPSTSPWWGSKTFWAVVAAVLAGAPAAVTKLTAVETSWQERLAVVASLCIAGAILYGRMASELGVKNNDEKIAAVAAAAQSEPRPGAAATLDAVRDSVDPSGGRGAIPSPPMERG